MFKTNVIVQGVEIRGVEKKHSEKSGRDYLLVRFDDETGARSEVVDRNLEREPYYRRGTFGDLIVAIDSGRYTNIEIRDFRISEITEGAR